LTSLSAPDRPYPGLFKYNRLKGGKSMKFKSTVAIVIAMTMTMAAFLPGCGKKQETNTPAASAQQSSAASTQAPEQEKKEIEMSIAMWDITEFGNDDIGKKIMNDLKVKINIVQLSWDNDLEQIKLFGASGNMPDFFTSYTTEYDIARFYGWLDQGLTRTIPEELVNKYPTVKSVFENSVAGQAVKAIQGSYAFIPRPESIKDYYKADQQMIYYRKDWMANVGITKAPETTDEFYTMLKAFTYNDPNKNGKADTYGLTSAKVSQALMTAWGTYPGSWIEQDGKFVPAYLTTNMIEPLKYLRKLYQEKIYDPEFSKNGYKQAIQKFTTNSFGALIRNGDLDWINKTITRTGL
jgi:ABC-type glycerol-3-phosphate transport system substrate-binding protein